MTKSTQKNAGPTPAKGAPSTPDNLAFKAIALPAVAAAARRKPPGRAERRTGLVLDPARYSD